MTFCGAPARGAVVMDGNADADDEAAALLVLAGDTTRLHVPAEAADPVVVYGGVRVAGGLIAGDAATGVLALLDELRADVARLKAEISAMQHRLLRYVGPWAVDDLQPLLIKSFDEQPHHGPHGVHFGSAVAFADVNGDGQKELLVGAHAFDTLPGENQNQGMLLLHALLALHSTARMPLSRHPCRLPHHPRFHLHRRSVRDFPLPNWHH